MLEPSGACTQYHGTANGRGKQAAKSEIEKKDFKSMTCKDALNHLGRILLTCSEESKDKSRELEFSIISEETAHEHKKLNAKESHDVLERVLSVIQREEEEDSD
jgi:20S proteasome subunit alpha 7